MKVIMLEDVENVGNKYDVKEVADGFARNFLIPKKLAKIADRDSLKWAKKQKEKMIQKAEEELKKIQAIATELDGREIEFILKTGKKGELFESVNAEKIAKKIKELGFDLKKNQIDLKKNINEIGEFPVKINLNQGIEAEIKIIISKKEDNDSLKEEE